MQRFALSFLGLLALAVSLAPAALGVRVHVRVEGKTQTIFGAGEPRFEAGASALDALDAASLRAEFYYHVVTSSFGRYVDQIGRYPAAGMGGWVFKVNGASPPVGADKVELKDGDRVLWYWATFGATGGPPTLRLGHFKTIYSKSRGPRPRTLDCYRVLAEDDSGKTRPAVGATLHVGARRVRTNRGRACILRPHASVRATLSGAVRSNAVE